MRFLINQYSCKIFLVFGLSIFFFTSSFGQVHTQVVGDSVLIHSNNGTGELILENATKNVGGFLFNKGNGRTEFRKGIIRLNDSLSLIGSDTLKMAVGLGSVFVKDGLTKVNDTLYLGNTTSGAGTNQFSANRYQYLNGKFYSIGGTRNNPDSFPVFRFYNNGNFSSNVTTEHNYPNIYKNGIRYNARMGYLEIGISSKIDTTISNLIGPYETSAIILNTDSQGDIKGQLQNSFIGAYNVQLPAGKTIRASMLTGGSFFMGASMTQSIAGGVYHTINGDINSSFIMGNSQQLQKSDANSGWFGAVNNNSNGTTLCNLTSGIFNSIGSVSQLTAGSYLINRSYASTILGNANVNFTSIPFNTADSIWYTSAQNIEGRYLLFALGNSGAKYAATRSNALSILYNGRTQINTKGFSSNLSESDVTPKAALEIVSTNSGVLLPKLTTAERNAITGTDLHNGLLLYNTDSSVFQYYTSVGWKTIEDTKAENIAASSLDFPSTSAGSSNDLTITVTGAVDGDIIALGVPNSATSPNSYFTAWVSAANTVTIRFNNYSNSAIDPAVGNFKIKIIR